MRTFFSILLFALLFNSPATKLVESAEESLQSHHPFTIDVDELEIIKASHEGNLPMVKKLVSEGALSKAFSVLGKGGLTALHSAIRGGHSAVAQYLLQEQENRCWFSSLLFLRDDVLLESAKGWNALMFASEIGDAAVLDRLLRRVNANYLLRQVPFKHQTPLLLASRNGHADVVELLLRKNPSSQHIRMPDSDVMTALMRAIEQGHLDVVKLLLQWDPDGMHQRHPKSAISPLFFASREGDVELVKFLLEEGASVQQASRTGLTPLVVASSNGHLQVVQHLLKHGAAVKERDNDGLTALMSASAAGHMPVVKLLLEHGACVRDHSKSGFTALMGASKAGSSEVVRLLLPLTSPQTEVNGGGCFPLIWASHAGHPEVLRQLLQWDPLSVNNRCSRGLSPLMYATTRGNTEVMDILLKHDASGVNDRDRDGKTSLIFASSAGHVDSAKLLLQHGASISLPDRNALTPLLHACKYGHSELVAELLQNWGASITDSTNNNETALYLACEGGHMQVLQLLLDEDASLEHVRFSRADGRSPMEAAFLNGHFKLVQKLFDIDPVAIYDFDFVNLVTQRIDSAGEEILNLFSTSSRAVEWTKLAAQVNQDSDGEGEHLYLASDREPVYYSCDSIKPSPHQYLSTVGR